MNTEESTENSVGPVRKEVRRGRPKKSDLAEAKKPGKGKVGRPTGDNGRIQELKARLLATTGDKVINKIVQIAQDDAHPGQMAALKMCIDRVLPLSLFEKDAKKGSNQVQINIVGVSSINTPDENVIDVSMEEVNNG